MNWQTRYEKRSSLTSDIEDLKTAEGVLISCLLGFAMYAITIVAILLWME